MSALQEPIVEAQLNIVRRDESYFVVFEFLGTANEVGPFSDIETATLIWNWIMDKAKQGGGIEITAPTSEAMQ